MKYPLSLQQLLDCDLPDTEARSLLSPINNILTHHSAEEAWQQLTQHILQSEHPFSFHQLLYKTTYKDWNQTLGPPPMWLPNDQSIAASNLLEVMTKLKVQNYEALWHWSIRDRENFWDTLIQRLGIQFQHPYSQILNLSDGVEAPHWCKNAKLNIVDSCFQAPPEAIAIIHQAPGQPITTWTYDGLKRMTARVANGLRQLGYQTGDAIAIDLPMTAESVAIYLGIISAGCIVVAIADSFAPNEIATRLQLANASAIFTQDSLLRHGKRLPLYEKVIQADAPPAFVRSTQANPIPLRPIDLTWDNFLSQNDQFVPIATDPDTPINILFSSGTTGDPKAIPWTQTTPIKCAMDGHLHHDIHPSDTVAWPTNLGWMMGPWLVFASLINQAAIALYSDVPTDRKFGQFIQDAGVTMLGVIPSLVRSWKHSQCMHGLNWNQIKVFSSTGECSNPDEMLYLSSLAGYKPIIEYCGGTEIGGGYLTSTVLQSNAPSTFTTPALGLEIAILDETGHPSNQGEVFILPPSIGLSTQLLNRNHHQVYFAHTPTPPATIEGAPAISLRRHGDRVERLASGHYRALGRVDDTMNLGGIKVSATELEQVLNRDPSVQETAAIAISPQDGGPAQLVIYAVLKSLDRPERNTLKKALQTRLKSQLNPLFQIHDLVLVNQLPRTASNKVMRRLLREKYHPNSD